MRWQVLASIAAVALLTVATASATVIDFSTDPNLATEWTRYDYYSQSGPGVTHTWNSTNQCLDLTSAGVATNVALYKNGTSRSDSDSVTLTLLNFTTPANDWANAGLIVSEQRAPILFDNTPSYAVGFGYDTSGFYYFGATKCSSSGVESIGRVNLGSCPASVVLNITRDGADYVFTANGVEVARDSSLSSTSLSNYMMYWGASGGTTLSVSADNFGVVPEPSAVAMLLAAGFGLLCYAWRKRK